MREFEIGEYMVKTKCPICKKKFKLKEKIILCPIQAPKEEGYFINARAISIHTKCYFVEEDKN